MKRISITVGCSSSVPAHHDFMMCVLTKGAHGRVRFERANGRVPEFRILCVQLSGYV
jgi:hypothetical protein